MAITVNIRNMGVFFVTLQMTGLLPCKKHLNVNGQVGTNAKEGSNVGSHAPRVPAIHTGSPSRNFFLLWCQVGAPSGYDLHTGEGCETIPRFHSGRSNAHTQRTECRHPHTRTEDPERQPELLVPPAPL